MSRYVLYVESPKNVIHIKEMERVICLLESSHAQETLVLNTDFG